MIEFKNITKHFLTKKNSVHALNDVSFQIDDGEIFGIVGFSGAGKSTLVRMINGLEKPSSGQVLVDGNDPGKLNKKELRAMRKQIGMVFQQFNLLNSKTVYENVAMPLILNKEDKQMIDKRVKEMLAFVELSDKLQSYPDQLSGGQKQRVGIARALAMNPKILLCDEATSALDPKTTDSILDLLKKINDDLGITIVIITHEMHVIEKICDHVAVMEKGSVIETGKVQDVFSAEESGVDTDDTDATVQDADVVSAEVQNETGVDVETATAEKTAGSENTAVTADAENEATETAEAVAEDTENADAIPAADSTSAPAVSETDTFSAAESEEADTPSTDLRALTDEELVQIITAKNSYEQLATAEEEKFRAENTALVENLEKLVSLALTYPSAEETYLQQFTAEAAQLYTSVNPVSRDTYAAVKALLDRYEKDYQSYADAMASLKAEVNGQELTFAELLNSLKEQTAKVEKDTADAAEADERILNLPTAVTKDNIHEVEAELASLQKFLDNMSEEARTYMWQKSQLTLVRTIVADYHVDLADKKDTFKSSRPKNLKTKVLNYKTIQVSWTGTDYADSYNVYRKTGTGSWKKIASGITGVSYKDTKAVTGTTYTYTVRAVSYTWGKAVLSKYDQTGVKGKAKLTAPTFTSVKTAGKNTVKATWKKVTGASGYRVYRSTSKNGKYTSAGLIKKGSTVTFKDKKVSKGKTYYYKVRAYRTVNGKRVYGPYSTVKSVKAK